MHRGITRGSYDGGKIAGLYDLEETLGRGHFAVVKLARHVFTGEKVAVKVIDKTKLDEVSRSHLFQEVRCMKLVQHPNVVRLYEVIDTHSKLYLILELADGGDLYDYIMRHESGLSESIAQEYFSQIVRAISYCHKLHVVHRDLKPENVVFFERIGVVKLTDFGLTPLSLRKKNPLDRDKVVLLILLGKLFDTFSAAVVLFSLYNLVVFDLKLKHYRFVGARNERIEHFHNSCASRRFSNKFCPGQKLETSCGSLAYSAPEILLGDSYDAPAVDIWSLGVILYMLVCGQAPFQEANDSETLTMIMDCKYTVPNHISEDCRRLIARMLVRQPEKRAKLEEIANDPWLKNTQFDIPALPLISRQHISDDDHSIIVQKMVNGDIATKEQILEALDKNAYNHITATYYLLAERKLRSMEPKHKHTSQQIPRVSVDSCTESNDPSPTHRVNHTLLGMPRPNIDVVQRGRKCSIVTEEEDEDDGATSDSSLHSSWNRRGSRSEGKLNLAVQELRKETVSGCPVHDCSLAGNSFNAASVQRSSKMLPAPLVSARSSPQLGLEEISEDGNVARSSSSTPRNFHSFEQRRSRFRKSRTASCSSSEASDEDSENRKKRESAKPLQGNQSDPKDPNGRGGAAGGQSSQAPQDPSFAEPEQNGSTSESTSSKNVDNRFKSSNTNGRKHYLCDRHKRKIETRLRESQSLNRITEVQESDLSPAMVASAFQTNTDNSLVNEKVNVIRQSNVLSRLVSRTDRFKRNAVISKCLTLQRKLCMPLLKRGRIYKTQSCTEVRNSKDINQNLKSTLKFTN